MVKQVETLGLNVRSAMRVAKLSEIFVAILFVADLQEVLAFKEVVDVSHIGISFADFELGD